MRARPKIESISFIGAGSLAAAMARGLRRCGYRIGEIVVRDRAKSKARGRALASQTRARLATVETASLSAPLIWFAVSDGAIRECAEALARQVEWAGKLVFHSSGALSSAELSALRERGAITASVHPMMTFVHGEPPSLRDVWFALEGQPRAATAARGIVKSLGGRSFVLSSEAKSLYHALGSFVSPLLVTELAAAEQVGMRAGLRPREVRRIVAPIVRRTVENFLEKGGAAALSGPLVRGDVGTIRKHVRELRRLPAEREVYLTLARYALDHLPVKGKKALRLELADGRRAGHEAKR